MLVDFLGEALQELLHLHRDGVSLVRSLGLLVDVANSVFLARSRRDDCYDVYLLVCHVACEGSRMGREGDGFV